MKSVRRVCVCVWLKDSLVWFTPCDRDLFVNTFRSIHSVSFSLGSCHVNNKIDDKTLNRILNDNRIDIDTMISHSWLRHGGCGTTTYSQFNHFLSLSLFVRLIAMSILRIEFVLHSQQHAISVRHLNVKHLEKNIHGSFNRLFLRLVFFRVWLIV